jgi:hypothetical protein
LCFIAIFVQSGCKEEAPGYSANTDGGNNAEQKSAAVSLSYENVVLPEGKTVNVEFWVENSEPLLPGTSVDIIDNTSPPPQRVIVSGAIVKSVRWKVSKPFTKPKYPASGFVAMTLAENQWKIIEGQDIGIRKSEK